MLLPGSSPDILELHLEELESLWQRRLGWLNSPSHGQHHLAELDERIEANIQGCLIAGDHLGPAVECRLASDEPEAVFAAAYSLLRTGLDDAARRVLDAFRESSGARLEGFRMALAHGPIEPILPNLRRATTTEAEPVAAAATEILAFHSRLDPEESLSRFFLSGQAEVRRSAWRAATWSGRAQTAELYRDGHRDPDAAVRREALHAAVWSRQPWLVGYCLGLATSPTIENGDTFRMLAVLGRPDHLRTIRDLIDCPDLGPSRFVILGAFGHPDVVETAIEGMDSPEPREAIAAGTAFTKITGCEIESGQRTTLPPEDGHEPDEFEREFLDEAFLPDTMKARTIWRKLKDSFSRGNRWCRGLDLSRGVDADVMAQLDLESRWEACLRGKHEGTWSGSPIDLEVFPQPQSVASGR